jgi:archaellum component FlaC
MKSPVVKLSPYERAINRLNDLPRNLDKIFSEAMEDLRRQRNESREELNQLMEDYQDLGRRYVEVAGELDVAREELKRLKSV